ncbi:hypothetical protein BC567DRAFT_42640 [Phyllosticta citribraziliensis]
MPNAVHWAAGTSGDTFAQHPRTRAPRRDRADALSLPLGRPSPACSYSAASSTTVATVPPSTLPARLRAPFRRHRRLTARRLTRTCQSQPWAPLLHYLTTRQDHSRLSRLVPTTDASPRAATPRPTRADVMDALLRLCAVATSPSLPSDSAPRRLR